MSLFKFQWLRNFLRKNTNPIPEEKAYFWKKRLAIVYMLLAWNGFGFVLYSVFSGESEWVKKYKTNEENALSPAQQWSRTLGIKDAKVVRISGFNVSQYEIHNEFEEAEKSIEGDNKQTSSKNNE